MLPDDHYTPENKEALIRRYATVTRELAQAYQEYKNCVTAERTVQHHEINRQLSEYPGTSQNRLDSIAREAAFPQWEARESCQATVKVLELERELLQDMLRMAP